MREAYVVPRVVVFADTPALVVALRIAQHIVVIRRLPSVGVYGHKLLEHRSMREDDAPKRKLNFKIWLMLLIIIELCKYAPFA